MKKARIADKENMKAIVIAILILLVFAVSTFASEGANCRLAVRTTFKNGKKKLEMIDVSAKTRGECRREAKKRELTSSSKDVQRVRVSFGWRDPALPRAD